MNNFQSPESLPKKVGQLQSSSQQERSTLQKSKEKGGNSDQYHLTASFGMAESQQGGIKSYFKGQKEGLYYKTSQEKNQDFPRQVNEIQISQTVANDDINQRETGQDEIYYQQDYTDVEQNYGGYQNPNELHFKSQEYNEDTLHQQQFQSINSNGQSQRQSLQNWNKQRQKSNQGVQQPIKQNESKIHTYLQQMVDNTKTLKNSEEEIYNYMSAPSTFSAGVGSQFQQNQQTEDQEVQRNAPPLPQIITSSQLTFSEIANLKQKQRQISQDKAKESKQKKLIDEIAHFYRQLAANKKGEENSRMNATSPSPIRTSEPRLSVQNKSPHTISFERKPSSSQTRNKGLSHSRSVTNVSKREDDIESQQFNANQSTAKENMRYSRDTYAQSVQQFSVSKNEKLNDLSNQENIQLPHQYHSERIDTKQSQSQSKGILKGSKERKQNNSYNSSIQSQQQKLSQKGLQIKDHNTSSQIFNSHRISIDNSEIENIPLTYVFYLTPIQFQTFENKLKKSEFSSIKVQILQKYKQLSENVKYANERPNYLSSVQEILESNGAKSNFRINVVQELQVIGKLSKKNLLSGIKDVLELTESYETITHDILAVEAQRNSKNKRNTRTSQQQEKDEQTVVVLKDMQMRLAQKIFFMYLRNIQLGYKKEINIQLNDFEEARNKLRLSISLNALKHYATIHSLKSQLQKITKNEIQSKRLKKMFDVIKKKGNKYIYYKPFVLAIRENHRRILKQNSIFSLFQNYQIKKAEKRKLELSKQIFMSHLITKSFLILKAFSNRKKSNVTIQTMTAKNISLSHTSELRSLILQPNTFYETKHFQWRFNSQNNAEETEYQSQEHQHEDQFKQTNRSSQLQRVSFDKNKILDHNEEIDLRASQNIDNRDSKYETSQNNERNNKFNEIQRQLSYNDYDLDQIEHIDQSYDSKQFQKHFYCEEEYLSSARNLLEAKRQITLDKLDRLKNMSHQQQDDQSSFLQRNKEKVQEQIRENYEDSFQNQERIIELQSDSKLNLVQIPTSQVKNEQISRREEHIKQEFQFDNQLDDYMIEEKDNSRSIVTLEQHIKQIIRVLKRLSKKKEQFKYKNPVDLLLKKDAFFQSISEQSSARNSSARSKQSNIPHPLQQYQDMIKRIEENEKKQTASYLFYHWKILFLERTLDAEISLLNSLKKCKKLLNIFKNKYRDNNEICILNQQIREEKIKNKVFQEWFSMSSETSERNKEKLYHFQTKICFRRILYFSAYSKIKRVADNFYLKNLKKNALNSWSKISRDNQDIRNRYKVSLTKRNFQQWVARTQKVIFLRRFWKKILYTPDEILFEKYGNKKNLLRAIIKSWRGIVIENENSMKQKLALKSAVQHRSVVRKTKAFFQWLKFIKLKRGLVKLFQSHIIKKTLSKKLLLPWKEAVSHQKFAVTIFRRKMNNNTLFKAFHSLKIKYLQNKVAKNCYLRKFFSYWKLQKDYRQQILPHGYYNRKLVKKCFTSIIYHQLLQMRERAKLEKSTKFFLHHITKFMQTCLTLWQKHSQKRKSKKLLKQKLKKYADKNLKKRAFNSFKLIKVLARLKTVQNKKALEFRYIQYQKKYNLQRLINEPHLNPQLQEVLTILHYWKAYATKQKNIKFIQSRINKFHNRRSLKYYFENWEKLYIQRNSLKQRYVDNSKENEVDQINFNQNKQKLQEKNTQNVEIQIRTNHQNQLSNQHHKQSDDNLIRFSQNLQNQIEDTKNKNDFNVDRVFKTLPKELSGPLPIDAQSQQPSQRSPRFLSNISRNSKSPSSKSNSPNYNKSTLKSNSSQENLRKSRKSVRFEIDPKQQNYPSALTTHRFDFFDQKYNENEAFYQKLLSQKRQNTTQN